MAAEFGINAGQQFDNTLVPRIKDTTARWVRVNFIIPPDYASLHDPGALCGYDRLIDAYQEAGIKVLALVGHESVRGGYDFARPEAFLPPYLNVWDALTERYGARIAAYQGFNEANNWWPGTSEPTISTRWYADYCEAIWQRVKVERGRNDLTILTGPLFTHDQNTAAEYVDEVLWLGQSRHSWGKGRPYPVDGFCLHLYVAQGTGDDKTVCQLLRRNVRAFRSAVSNYVPRAQLWVSEIGWTTQSVSECDQARNLGTAFRLLKSEPRVGPVFWYGLQDWRDPNGNEGHYGLYDTTGEPKTSLFAFRCEAR